MFLKPRLAAAAAPGGGTMIVAAAFLLGLGAGAVFNPAVFGRAGTGAASAPPPSSLSQLRLAPGSHPVDVLRVNDGDTFEARVHIWPGMQVTTKVRLRGIDAAELKARCAEEYKLAQAAREALQKLLDEGGVSIGRIDFDKYGGRVVADAAVRNSGDVSAALLRTGLVRAYGGGRRESWCGQTSAR